MTIWRSWAGSASIDGRPSARSRRSSAFLERDAARSCPISRTVAERSTGTVASSPRPAKTSICRVSSAARRDAVWICSTSGRTVDGGGSSARARSVLPRMAVRRLLKSCAMPPARIPRLSSFWAWSSWRSRLRRSSSASLSAVMSLDEQTAETHAPLRVLDRGNRRYVVPVAVRPGHAHLDDLPLPRAEDLAQECKALVRLLLGKDIPDGLADDLLDRLADALGEGVVDVLVATIGCEGEGGVGRLREKDAAMLQLHGFSASGRTLPLQVARRSWPARSPGPPCSGLILPAGLPFLLMLTPRSLSSPSRMSYTQPWTEIPWLRPQAS